MKTRKLTTEDIKKVIKEEISKEVVIKDLSKQLKKISRTVTIPISVELPIYFYWEGDWNKNRLYEFGLQTDTINKILYKAVETSEKKQEIDEQLKSLRDLCDQYAKKFGMTKNDFWSLL